MHAAVQQVPGLPIDTLALSAPLHAERGGGARAGAAGAGRGGLAAARRAQDAAVRRCQPSQRRCQPSRHAAAMAGLQPLPALLPECHLHPSYDCLPCRAQHACGAINSSSATVRRCNHFSCPSRPKQLGGHRRPQAAAIAAAACCALRASRWLGAERGGAPAGPIEVERRPAGCSQWGLFSGVCCTRCAALRSHRLDSTCIACRAVQSVAACSA